MYHCLLWFSLSTLTSILASPVYSPSTDSIITENNPETLIPSTEDFSVAAVTNDETQNSATGFVIENSNPAYLERNENWVAEDDPNKLTVGQ